jgi:membrane-bound ClpP family serine protease
MLNKVIYLLLSGGILFLSFDNLDYSDIKGVVILLLLIGIFLIILKYVQKIFPK